jgi:hypothetical protein
MLFLHFLCSALWMINHAFALPQSGPLADHPPANPDISDVNEDLVQSGDAARQASLESEKNDAFWKGVQWGVAPGLAVGASVMAAWTANRLRFFKCIDEKLISEAKAQDDQQAVSGPPLFEYASKWYDECKWWSGSRDNRLRNVRIIEAYIRKMEKRAGRIKKASRKTTTIAPPPDSGTSMPDPNKPPDGSNPQQTNGKKPRTTGQKLRQAWNKVVRKAGNKMHSVVDNAAEKLVPVARAFNSVNGAPAPGVPFSPAVNNVPRLPGVLKL